MDGQRRRSQVTLFDDVEMTQFTAGYVIRDARTLLRVPLRFPLRLWVKIHLPKNENIDRLKDSLVIAVRGVVSQRGHPCVKVSWAQSGQD